MANKPWARILGATTAIGAVVALWASGPAFAQVTPARQDTAPSASAPAAAPGNRATALVNDVQMLKQQNRELLGQIEQLRHQIGQLKEINKEQYVLLDTRIKQLEGKPATPVTSGSTDDQPATPAQATTTPAPASVASVASPAQEGPAPASASTVLTANPDAQKAYNTAFNALRAGDFVASSRGFQAFIEQYPHDQLTPNAWYWLGESYYITQNYPQALKAFDQVIQRFPDSRKTPGALLKKGYSQYALKQTDAARATLESVISKYPDSSVAQLAQQRLEDIRLQKQLH